MERDVSFWRIFGNLKGLGEANGKALFLTPLSLRSAECKNYTMDEGI